MQKLGKIVLLALKLLPFTLYIILQSIYDLYLYLICYFSPSTKLNGSKELCCNYKNKTKNASSINFTRYLLPAISTRKLFINTCKLFPLRLKQLKESPSVLTLGAPFLMSYLWEIELHVWCFIFAKQRHIQDFEMMMDYYEKVNSRYKFDQLNI